MMIILLRWLKWEKYEKSKKKESEREREKSWSRKLSEENVNNFKAILGLVQIKEPQMAARRSFQKMNYF